MTNIPTMLNNFTKFLQKQLDPLVDQEEQQEEDEQNKIPQANVAVFWDYENIPIPKDANETLFFEALFSSSNEERYITKRVYAKEIIINSKLKIIEENGFEYKKGVLSGKQNEIDHQLMTDCIDYCKESEDLLIVVLMAGDADYISLIEKLTEIGHEVRIVCNNKNKLSKVLRDIIPVIFDRELIFKEIKRLKKQLYTFTTLANYLLSMQDNQSLPVSELIDEIQKYYFRNINLQFSSYIKLLQNLPEFNWQYRFSNNIIQKLSLPGSSDPNDPVQTRTLARKSFLYYKLGYEDEFEEWLKTWNEYQSLEKNSENQKEFLMQLYQMIAIPQIRNFIQRELLKILLKQQSNQLHPSNVIFKEKKDIDEFIKEIYERDQQKKKFKCSKCKKSFQSDASLTQHTNAVHKNKRPPYLCKICGKNLINEKNVENHLKQTHKSNETPLPHECNICYLRFSTNKGLEQHKSNKH